MPAVAGVSDDAVEPCEEGGEVAEGDRLSLFARPRDFARGRVSGEIAYRSDVSVPVVPRSSDCAVAQRSKSAERIVPAASRISTSSIASITAPGLSPAASAGLDGSTREMTSSPSIGVSSAPIDPTSDGSAAALSSRTRTADDSRSKCEWPMRVSRSRNTSRTSSGVVARAARGRNSARNASQSASVRDSST